MPRYKPQETHSLLLPVILSEQIQPGSFAFMPKSACFMALVLSAHGLTEHIGSGFVQTSPSL